MPEKMWRIHKLIRHMRINADYENSQEDQHLTGNYKRLKADHCSPADDDDDDETAIMSEQRSSKAEARLEASEELLHPRQRSPARFWLLFVSSVTAVLLVLMAIATILQSQSQAQKTTTKAGSLKPAKLGLDCGHSLAEARANGCEFDLLSYSWTPSSCYERETDLEFREWVHNPERQFGPFPFFIDQEGTARVTDEESLSFRVGTLAHTTQEEHLGHCIFWMRRIERILEGKGRFTERGDGVPHALHCTKSLLARLDGQNPKDKDELHAVIGIGFNTC